MRINISQCEYTTQRFLKSEFEFQRFIAAARAIGEPQLVMLYADSAAKFPKDRFPIEVYFHPSLLNRIIRSGNKYAKDLSSILTYGFIGESRGGKNGVVVIPQRDVNLQSVVDNYQRADYSEFGKLAGVPNNPREIIGVKVVSHRKSGERIVGILQRPVLESNRPGKAVLYDTRYY